jgi:2',3'-cyclic-nucleotide 2'-phosphodiesterase/3'-nucleotidase
MLSLAAALVFAAAPLQDTAHVVLVATTDIHGHATDWDYVTDRPFAGGVARVAAVVDSLRARYPGRVLLVDAGDLLQGDPFATYYARVAPTRPHPIIEALNLAGYDAATPGNHDFDWGLPFFQQAVAEARFPYVSANLYLGRSDSLLFPAWRVVQRQGVRIAITGLTTPGTMVWDRDQLGRARVAPILPAAAPVLEAMRRDADVIVALVHSGLDGRASYDTTGVGDENVAAGLATLPARPDVVVVGHSHREIRDSVIGGVHFVQPRPFGASVSVVHLDLVREDGVWHLKRVRADLVSTRDVAASALLAQRLSAERDAVRTWARTAIGLATVPMRATAARVGAAPVLDFIQDVQRRRTGAPLSAASAFDLRAGFDADTIRVAHVLALYPFDNTLRAIRLSGGQLKAYLEWSARYYQVDPAGRIGLNDSVPGYNYDVVAGASYDIDLRRPVGDRTERARAAGRAGRQLHHGDQQLPADRRRRLRHGARRAGGLRQGRAHRRPADRRRSRPEPARFGRPHGDLQLADRARGRRSRRPRALQPASPAAAQGRARHHRAPGPRHRGPPRALPPGGRRARRRARQPGRRVRLRAAPPRRRRRRAGHAGPGRDPRPRGHGAARAPRLCRRGTGRP